MQLCVNGTRIWCADSTNMGVNSVHRWHQKWSNTDRQTDVLAAHVVSADEAKVHRKAGNGTALLAGAVARCACHNTASTCKEASVGLCCVRASVCPTKQGKTSPHKVMLYVELHYIITSTHDRASAFSAKLVHRDETRNKYVECRN